MSTSDVLIIIGAVTVSLTTVISAVGTVLIASRTGSIQRTGMLTHDAVNSRSDAMMAMLEKQRSALQDAGVKLPTDDSLKGKQ